jgi:hypothetical protein
LVASVHTGATTDTHVLKALSDIDTSGAYLNTDAAVHAIPYAMSTVIDFAGSRATGLSSRGIIGHHKSIAVYHHALKTRIGTHVFTNLLA